MVNKFDLLSDGLFTELVQNSGSIADVLRSLDYSVKGNSWAYRIVKERMDKLGVSFLKKANYNTCNTKLSLSDILVEDSAYNSSRLRDRLISEGIKENECEICNIKDWQGKPIAFQLHHINGNHHDNRLENLQILCPNCHSLTENYGTKGKERKVTKKAEELPLEIKKEIMDKVAEVGIVEARKQLTYRNSLINSVVKQNHDIVVMICPDKTEMEFPTIQGAGNYLHDELGFGASAKVVRSNISNCLAGKQKTCHGYSFYRKSGLELNN